MRAGNLRHLINIQSNATTYGTMNQPTVTWSDSTAIWAGIKVISGSESIESNKIEAKLRRLEVTTRYDAAMVPKVVFKWNSKLFEIISVDNINYKDFTMITTAMEFVD